MTFKSSLVFKHYVYKLCWGNYPSLKVEVTVLLQDNSIPKLIQFKTFYWDGIYAQAYFSSEDCAEFLTPPVTRSLMWWTDFILKKLTIDLQINGPFLKVYCVGILPCSLEPPSMPEKKRKNKYVEWLRGRKILEMFAKLRYICVKYWLLTQRNGRM